MVNLFTAEATANADFTGAPGIEVSGVASIYKMTYENEFSIFGLKIELSGNLYVGAVGAGAEFDWDEGKFKIAPPMCGLGFDFGIDID